MITIVRKKYGYTNTESWFATEISNRSIFKLYHYRQVLNRIPVSGFYVEEFHTLITDLSDSEDVLYKKCSSTVRNEIKRAEREGVVFEYNVSISRFVPFFNEFACLKGLEEIKESRMKAYGRHYIVTEAVLDNCILVAHSYIIDESLKRVRLFQSATKRFSETIDHNLIGRANKYLHYKDMLKFKELDYTIYDWGGVAIEPTDTSLIGINKFKYSFGGDKVVEYNYASIPYNWFMRIKKVLNCCRLNSQIHPQTTIL